MSTEKGKRGFAGSQREAAAPSTKVWDDAQAKVRAAFRAFDAAADVENSDSLLPAKAEHDLYLEARDELIGTPAPNGAALAFKIGLYGYTAITDHFDVSAGVFQPDRIAKIIGSDDDAEKGLLALYFDALALAGVQATVAQPAAFGDDTALLQAVADYDAARSARMALFALPPRDEEVNEWPEHKALKAQEDEAYERILAQRPVTAAGLRALAAAAERFSSYRVSGADRIGEVDKRLHWALVDALKGTVPVEVVSNSRLGQGWAAFKAEYLAALAIYNRKTIDEDSRDRDLHDEHRILYDKLLAFPVESVAEAADKLSTIMVDCWDEADAITALQGDLARLNATPPTSGGGSPTGEVSSEWRALEETLRAAYEKLGATSSEAPEFAGLDEAHEAAFKAAFAYAPKSLLEFARKAVAVVDWGGGHSVDEALARDAAAVLTAASPNAPAASSAATEWSAAAADYHEAERRFIDATAKVNAADEAAVAASAPPPELMFVPLGKKDAREYLTEEEIVTDTRLGVEERLAKVKRFREWAALRTAAYEDHGANEAEGDFDAAVDALDQAKNRLWELTPPDAEGLRLKLQIHIEDYQLHNLAGIDLDEEGLSCLLTSEDQTDREIGRIYRDLVSIVDPGSPLARVTAFDALGWIEEFEKLPGHVVAEFGITFMEPDAFPDGVEGKTPPPGRALCDALTDWQRKAVRRAGRHRDGVRRIVKDIVMTFANSWDTREEVAAIMEKRHPNASARQMTDAWDQVDAMDDVVFGLSEEEAKARAGTRWLAAWRIGGGSAWIDRETNELVIGCSPNDLGSNMTFMRDEITRLPELKAAVREVLASEVA